MLPPKDLQFAFAAPGRDAAIARNMARNMALDTLIASFLCIKEDKLVVVLSSRPVGRLILSPRPLIVSTRLISSHAGGGGLVASRALLLANA